MLAPVLEVWRRIRQTCAWIALGVALIIPVVVLFLRGISDAAGVAQLVSLPFAALSIVISIPSWFHQTDSQTGQVSTTTTENQIPPKRRPGREQGLLSGQHGPVPLDEETFPQPHSLNDESIPSNNFYHVRKFRLAIALMPVLALAIAGTVFAINHTGSPPGILRAEYPIGDALDINIQQVKNASNGVLGFVFPTDRSQEASSFLKVDANEDYDKVLTEALDSGAYLIGGVKLYVRLSARNDEDATVFNIRPIVKREPVATGLAFPPFSQGTPKDQINFLLDDPASVAQSTDEYGTRLGPFFDQQSISVNPHLAPELTLTFLVRKAAFSFTFEVLYTVNGKNFRQVVDWHGRQLKASADLCVGQALRKVLGVDADRLSRLRYQEIRSMGFTTDSAKRYYILENPNDYAAQCATK